MKLTELNISENPLGNAGLTVFSLTNLTDLRMSRCELTAISVSVGKLRALEIFDISQNRISDLPESLFGLERLCNFRVSENAIEILPSAIGFATSLKILTLHINKLSSLPLSVSKLKLLSVATFSRNALCRIPSVVGGFASLGVLTLSNCSLQEYPSILCSGSFLLLTELWLSNNSIPSIPAEIKKLVRLQQLWLNHNKLTYIHRDIRILAIKILSLYGNLDLEVPDCIRQMKIDIFYDVEFDSALAENAENSMTLLKPST
jgi:Leucine-rich repeat (LRR) protein